jgi:molybdopterin-guanine dinucleotide biosynthesis protein A
VERLRSALPEVVVVAADGQELPDVGAPVLRDGRSAQGPLGGLEVALRAASAEAVFAVSCDAPFLQPALVRRVASALEGHDAAVPRWEGRPQPLLAAYRTSLLPLVSRMLDGGRLRPAFLLDSVDTRILEEDELREADPAGLSFINVNDPEAYRAALEAAPPTVVFELFGQPRLLAGVREVAVDVAGLANLGSALAALARSAPPLVGPVLEPAGGLGPAFVLSTGGRAFTRDADRPVTDGERILLMAASAGG